MWFFLLILTLLSIALVLIYSDAQNNKLLRTVTHKGRGTWSERNLVLQLLKNGFSSEQIFHDLYIKKSDGTYSQVDLVLVTEIGMIVIEVKDLSGWIFGTGNQSKWYQVLAYGKQKYAFYNPIFQNDSHIKALKNRIPNAYDIPFYSLIVFYGNCELKHLSLIPREIKIARSVNSIEVIMNLTQNERGISYSNLSAIEAVLFESINYGEDIDIRMQHAENISKFISTQ